MVESSEQLQLVFDKAVDVAKKLQHEYVTIQHLLFAMLCEESFAKVHRRLWCGSQYQKRILKII